MVCDKAQHVAVYAQNDSVESVAQVCSALRNRVKDGLNIGRRPAEDTQHLCRCSLVFERLLQLSGAGLQLILPRLHFLKQPRVLDGHDGLIGEGLYKLDLLDCKWLRRRSTDGHGPDAASLSEQRDAELRAVATKWLGSVTVFRIGEHVRNVYNPALQRDTSRDSISAGGNRMLPHVFFQLRRVSVASRNAIDVAITKENEVVLRLAQPSCRLHERIEHRLQIEGRAADDLEHVSGHRLLLQSFGQISVPCLHFLKQPRVLDRDDSLAGERLKKLDLSRRKASDLRS